MFKKTLTLISITIIALSFLFLQDWFWLYVDSAGYPISFERYTQLLSATLNSFSNVTYFWHDSSSQLWPRYLQTLFKVLPQSLYYLIFFFGSFFSAFYLLKIFFDKNASFYWALFFTFNPVSIYLLQQVWYLYSYFSLNLVLLGIYFYLKSWKCIPLLLFSIWVLLFPAYGRILGIYWTFLLLLWLLYRREILKAFEVKKTRSFILIYLAIIVSLPFLVSFIYPYFSWEKEYFTWMANFVSQAEWWGKSLYKNNQSLPFIQAFYPQEIQQNFSGDWNNSFIYKLYSTLFFIWIIFSFLLIQLKQTGKRLWTFLFWILLVSILIIAWWKFFSEELFHAIVYNYYPFIVNNTRWMFLIVVPIYAFIISYLYMKSSAKQKSIFKSIIILYILIIVFPLTPISQNAKTKLVDLAPEYYELLQEKKEILGSSVILPQRTLLLDWNPYHIKINNNINFTEMFQSDSRRVNNKQSSLYKSINDLDINYISNFNILNLKNILIFKDIVNISNSTFNWYNWEWLKEKSELDYQKLLNSYSYEASEDTQKYAIFWPVNKSSFEFFIYSPKTILNYDLEDFATEQINLESKAIIVDPYSFQKPDIMDSLQISETNQSVKIDYKISNVNTTKHVLKISNVDISNSFLLQMNQTFSTNWKLKWITENDYNSYVCSWAIQDFTITDNSFCHYSDWYLWSLSNYKYINKKEIAEKNHFEWNFVWNAWLINPEDIISSDNNVLYAVIVYEKQFWYIVSVVVSISTILLLILLTSIQIITLWISKKNEK